MTRQFSSVIIFLEIEAEADGKALKREVAIAVGDGPRVVVVDKRHESVLVEEDVEFPAEFDPEMVAVLGKELVPLDA